MFGRYLEHPESDLKDLGTVAIVGKRATSPWLVCEYFYFINYIYSCLISWVIAFPFDKYCKNYYRFHMFSYLYHITGPRHFTYIYGYAILLHVHWYTRTPLYQTLCHHYWPTDTLDTVLHVNIWNTTQDTSLYVHDHWYMDTRQCHFTCQYHRPTDILIHWAQ